MSKIAQKPRKLETTFIDTLQDGILKPLLEFVKSDTTLCLQIRSNYINIYYRGGNIIKIAEQGKHYIPSFDEKYFAEKKNKILIPKIFKSEEDVKSWIDGIPHFKHAMDRYFGKNPKNEREFQQLVLRENNGKSIGHTTDYFIVDIEYDNRKKARFDMVAFNWDSRRGLGRKNPKKFKPILTIIEMKYGDVVLTDKAGIVKHIEDMCKYACEEGFDGLKQEMVNSFKQQRDLGLIPALKNNPHSIETLDKQVDYLFILANHNPESDELRKVLDEVEKKFGKADLGFTIKFAVSNFMGYGLYRDNVYSLQEFRERFKGQISCKS